MVILDIKIDNFYAFKDFHINMSYPSIVVNSLIKMEHLSDRPNFRYRKVNVIMGANATGKTTFGKMVMRLFNFMDNKQYEPLTSVICAPEKSASVTMDFVAEKNILHRLDLKIRPRAEEKYRAEDIDVHVTSTEIGQKDSYETCARRLAFSNSSENFITELEKLQEISEMFNYSSDSEITFRSVNIQDKILYTRVLESTLKVLDCSVKKVKPVANVKGAYVVHMGNKSVIIKDGKAITTELLSSGTLNGIEIANIIYSMAKDKYGLYYCDGKFTGVHSDIEKAFLSLMIEVMKEDTQLFFTTHNQDILEMQFPKHTFIFFKKDSLDPERRITCVNASGLLK